MRRLINDFLFLLSGLPAAAAWFALLLAGWLTAALLAITPLVVPVLLALRWATRTLAAGEAAVARELLEVDARVPAIAAGLPGYANRIRSVLADAAFWRQQAYGALRMTAGFATGIVAASAVAWSLLLISLPITYRWVDMWQVHTLGRGFAAPPVGIAALAVSGALVDVLARVWRGLAAPLLCETSAASISRDRAFRAHVVLYL